MRRSFLFFLIPLLALIGCVREQPGTPDPVPSEEPKDSPSVVSGEANILLDDGLVALVEDALTTGSFTSTKSASFNGFIEALGITSMERVFPDAGEFEARHRAFGLHKWYHVRYENPIPQTKAGALALDYEGIQSWVPVRKIKSDALPFNDTYLNQQWHYYNDGSGSRKAGSDVNVYPVWEHYTTGSPDVIVAVVDGGIDYNHEDLSGQVLLNKSKNFKTGTTVISAHDHGTHVAGTIAAINNNGKGVSGVAGGDAKKNNPGVRLISCQIFVAGQNGSGSGSDAITWAADHGAVLANNSWGIDYDGISDPGERMRQAQEDHEFFAQPNTYPYQHPLKSAVDYFNATAGMTDGVQTGPMAGGLVLFSAGNDNMEYGGYAAYPGVMAVGAVGPRGTRAYYSCYGDWVDICAPGGDANQEMILSTLPNNQYGWYQGTSMACPHATGVAALVVSYYGKIGFTRQMLWDRLIGGARTGFVPTGLYIGPLIDALGAITYGEDYTPSPVSNPTSEVASNKATIGWKVTGNSGVPAYGYLLLVGKNQQDVAASTPSDVKSGVTSYTKETESGASIGSDTSYQINGLDFHTTYYCKIYGYDYCLNYSTASSVFSFTTLDNSAPVLTPDAEVSGIVLHAFQEYQVNIAIADPDGHSFTVVHTPGSSTETFIFNGNTGIGLFKVSGKNGTLGNHTAVITATDEYGKAGTLQISYSIVNEPPVVLKPVENILFTQLGQQCSINMAEYVADPDGETLTYKVQNSAPLIAHFNPTNGMLYGAAIAPGLSEVTITGTDAMGESVSLSFKAMVRTASADIVSYPNPVVDKVSFSNAQAQPVDMHIRIYSASGAKVYEGTLPASAFDPAVVDLSACAPGRYTAFVAYGGKETQQTIIKK